MIPENVRFSRCTFSKKNGPYISLKFPENVRFSYYQFRKNLAPVGYTPFPRRNTFSRMGTDIRVRTDLLQEPAMTDTGREDLKEKVLSVNDLIAYQPGTVASRMIVFKKAGTIMVFSFDAEKAFPNIPLPTMRCSR